MSTCKHCLEDIKELASTCKYCQKSQIFGKEGLIFFATISVLLSIAWGMFNFGLSYYKNVFGVDEVVALEFRSVNKALFLNRGPRKITLLKLVLTIPDLNIKNRMIDLNTTLGPGEVVEILIDKKDLKTSFAPFNDSIDLKIARDHDDERLLAGATILGDPEYESVKISYLAPIRRQKEKGKEGIYNFNGYTCNGKLSFLPAGEAKLSEKDFPCVGVIFINREKISDQEYFLLRKG